LKKMPYNYSSLYGGAAMDAKKKMAVGLGVGLSLLVVTIVLGVLGGMGRLGGPVAAKIMTDMVSSCKLSTLLGPKTIAKLAHTSVPDTPAASSMSRGYRDVPIVPVVPDMGQDYGLGTLNCIVGLKDAACPDMMAGVSLCLTNAKILPTESMQ
jgi:hypothetical protein